VTLSAANAIAHLDPTGNRFTEYIIPSSASLPIGVVSGTNNALWFTEAGNDKIGMLNP
jgi:streptogramin lyase